MFTRIIKELTVAARNGGGDPDSNPRLRTVIADAKAVNMPADNIKKAIQRGTGELPGVNYEEVTYEGYGPGGAAVIIETLTDNKNRTVGELRHMLDEAQRQPRRDQLASPGCSRRRATSSSRRPRADEEKLLNAVLEAGGDDLRDDGDTWEVLDGAFGLRGGARRGEGARHRAGHARRSRCCRRTTSSSKARTRPAMVKLMDALDDHDDVKQVWSNFDIEEKEIEASLA